jgi:hypothetical protein
LGCRRSKYRRHFDKGQREKKKNEKKTREMKKGLSYPSKEPIELNRTVE